MKTVAPLMLAALLAILINGCMVINMTNHRNITTGQELLDLQKAHEAGVLTDAEYAEAKRQALKSLDEFSNFNTDQKEKKK